MKRTLAALLLAGILAVAVMFGLAPTAPNNAGAYCYWVGLGGSGQCM
jgi:hypothetical protein